MNGFSYDLEQKKITIEDDTSVVIWESVEQEIADKADEMCNSGKTCKDIDAFLLKNGCKRGWGYKNEHDKKTPN